MDPEQIRAGLEVPDTVKFASSQPQYNMIWRAPEAEVFELCRRHGISQIVWSPLAQGVLTGKYAPGEPPPAESRAGDEQMGEPIQGYLRDGLLEAVQRLGPVAEEAGLTMVQLALAWVLRRPEVASAIIGASAGAGARQGIGGRAVGVDVLEAIDDALGSQIVAGPELAAFAEPGVLHRQTAPDS